MMKSNLRAALLLTAAFALIAVPLWLCIGDGLRTALFALLKLVVTK